MIKPVHRFQHHMSELTASKMQAIGLCIMAISKLQKKLRNRNTMYQGEKGIMLKIQGRDDPDKIHYHCLKAINHYNPLPI